MKSIVFIIFAICFLQKRVFCQIPVQTTTKPGEIVTGSFPAIETSTTVHQWFQSTSEEPTQFVEEITTTQSTTETPEPNPCEGHYGERIPHPDKEKCYIYIFCILSIPFEYICAPENIFDVQQGLCVPGSCN
jgi:hypothetical protein